MNATFLSAKSAKMDFYSISRKKIVLFYIKKKKKEIYFQRANKSALV